MEYEGKQVLSCVPMKSVVCIQTRLCQQYMFYGEGEWFNLTTLFGYDFENEIQNLIIMTKEDWILKHFTVWQCLILREVILTLVFKENSYLNLNADGK